MKFLILLMCVISQSASASYSLLLRDSRYPQRPFTVNVPDFNKEGISTLESYLMKGTVTRDENGSPQIGIVNGTLIHSERNAKHDWNFALSPDDVSFSDFTIELCDGQFTDIENDPDYWFGTVGQFCPWNTKNLAQEIRKNGKLLYRR